MISQRGGTAARILERAGWLAAGSEALAGMPMPWARQLRLANVRGEIAVIYAESAAAASLARMHTDDIRRCLARRRIQCSQVQVKVRPATRAGQTHGGNRQDDVLENP